MPSLKSLEVLPDEVSISKDFIATMNTNATGLEKLILPFIGNKPSNKIIPKLTSLRDLTLILNHKDDVKTAKTNYVKFVEMSLQHCTNLVSLALEGTYSISYET